MKTQQLRYSEIVAMTVLSLLLVAAALFRWAHLELTEVLGFVTGGVCVWLAVREHIWNWPLGLANNVFFFLLFWRSRLFADMGLQVVCFALGVYGWRNWLYGSAARAQLRISRTTRWEWLSLLLFVPLGTFVLRAVLLAVNGAAPFWDAATTVLSLAAQYLLCRKRLENWFFWITADIIYIPLYVSRALPLTAFLYGVFLVLSLIGLNEWRRSSRLWRAPAIGEAV